MKRVLFSLLLLTSTLFVCGQSFYQLPQGNNSQCAYVDPRMCQPIVSTSLPLFQLFKGGPDAGLIASGGTVIADTGQTMTFSRASDVFCQKADLSLATVSSGSACVEPGGLVLRPATVQIEKYSDDLKKWSYDHGYIDGGITSPANDTTAFVLCPNTDTTAGREFYINPSAPGPGDYYLSFWARPHAQQSTFVASFAGNTANSVIWNIDSGWLGQQTGSHYGISSGITGFYTLPGPNGWVLYGQKFNEAIGISYTEFFPADSYAHAQGSWAGDGTHCLEFWGPMLTASENYQPYFPNTGTGNTTRAADVAYWTNPLSNSDTQWCFSSYITPDSQFWDDGARHGLMQLGTTNAAANTADLWIHDGGALVFDVYDTTGTVKTATSQTTIWAGTRWIQACNDGGVLSLDMDQKALGTDISGAGTGTISTQPARFYTGSLGGSTQLGGPEMDVCLHNSMTKCTWAVYGRPGYTNHSLWAYGDSLTHNSINTPYYPELLAADLPTWHIVNGGLAASNFVDLWNLYLGWRPSDESQNWGGYGYQYVSWMANINDTGATVAEVEMLDKAFFDKLDAHARGAQVVILRESPWSHGGTWSSGAQTKYDSLQTWVAGWASRTGHLYDDLYTKMRDAGAGDPPTLSCIFDYGTDGTDGCTSNNYVHWSDAGQVFGKNELKTTIGQ